MDWFRKVCCWSLLVAALVLVQASGAVAGMTGHVEGNRVHWSADTAYAVSQGLQFLGMYHSSGNGGIVNSPTKSYSTVIENAVFAQVDAATGRIAELFVAQWERFPVRLAAQGAMETRFYDFRVPKFKGLEDFLKEKGVAFDELYYGGMVQGTADTSTRTRYFYVVAAAALPKDGDRRAFVQQRFAANLSKASQ